MPKGYWIGRVDVHNEEGYKPYMANNPAIFQKFGGKFVVRGGKTRTLEGGWTPSRIVVLEFPTYEKAEEFYDSEHYKPLLDMRLKAGNSKAILVDGYAG